MGEVNPSPTSYKTEAIEILSNRKKAARTVFSPLRKNQSQKEAEKSPDVGTYQKSSEILLTSPQSTKFGRSVRKMAFLGNLKSKSPGAGQYESVDLNKINRRIGGRGRYS